MQARTRWDRSAAILNAAGLLAQASDVADTVNDALAGLGVRVTIYLVDREQVAMRPLPSMSSRHAGAPPAPLSVDGTLAGRAYRSVRPMPWPRIDDRIWWPIVDGAERLGVLDAQLPPGMSARDPAVHEGLRAVAVAVGHFLVAKIAYGDSLRRARRSQAMSVGAELLWHTLPPLTFATHSLAIAAVLEPCYRAGGDAFDYAVDHDVAYVGIFDAVGHDLEASLTTTLTLAATRAARIRGDDLTGIAESADEALTWEFDDLRYTTAVLATLDLRRGTLRYLTAGHPGAVLLRRGRGIITLNGARRTPLGIVGPRSSIAQEALEPGDRLVLYTDGITEARSPAGIPFGTDHLVDLAVRYANDGLPAPEIARRIGLAVTSHKHGTLQDDATVMLLDWDPGGAGYSMTP